MLPVYPASILAEPPAEPRMSVWQRLQRTFSMLRVRRERLIELERGRIVALALVLQVLALAVLASGLWLGQRTAALASAHAAAGFVDQRLDELGATLQQVRGGLPEATGEPWACTDELTRQLLRTSLDSLLIQRLWLVAGDGVQACGPQGAGSVGELPPVPGHSLALVSRRGISAEPVVAQRLPDGRLLAAKLDPRAMALPHDGPWGYADARGEHITLQLSDQRELLLWDAAKTLVAPVPVLRVHLPSARHDHAVTVELDRSVFFARVMAWWPVAAATAALILLVICGWVWRRAVARSRLVVRIERALHKRQFEPFVQPIVDMATGRCVGGEVLMRWAHPERGILPPSEFIDEAERTGLIVGMSTLVMGRAAHRLAPLAQAHPELYFSFNVTAGQLRRPTFAAELADIFNADSLPRPQVLLELTEREALDPQTQLTVRALHAAGWRIAIDDFGTGQSSLATLEQMPIDRLKIDRAFVSAVGEQTARRPVLDAIIGLARDLDIRLVAEGVETQAQWDYLAQRQVASAQGYLVAKPMALDAFGRWFEGRLAPAGAATDASGASGVSPARPAGLAMQGPAALLHDARLAGFWRAMQSTGGVDIRDRLFHLRMYPQCFIGREAVDWLVRHAGVSRAEAIRMGRRLVALGCMKHVLNEHDFEDGEYFYAVVPDSVQDTPQPAAVDLLEALRSLNGPRQADHVRGLLRHRRCLRGADLVDWLCGRYQVPRVTALQWGAQLMKQGRLRHVFDDRPLSDSTALFRLT
jgi:EAL domain-containing protein (putative c-di-GMP-specific phosphodiesterase class I)